MIGSAADSRQASRAAGALLLVAAVYGITLATIETRAFWITDNANKFLQLQAILESDYRDFSLQWSGRDVDPDLALHPLRPPFVQIRQGRILSQYPPAFATLSTLPFRWLGFTGLYLLPLLGGLLSLWAVGRIAADLAPRAPAAPAVAILLAGLGTPVWFYSVCFWEHTLALASILWAGWCAMRFVRTGEASLAVAAASMSGLAAWFRQDHLLLAACLMVWTLTRQRPARTLALWGGGLVTTLGPLAWFHQFATGHPLGLHMAANMAGPLDHIGARPLVAWRMFVAAGSNTALSVLITLPFLAAAVVRPKLDAMTFRRVFPLAGGIAAVCGAVTLGGLALADRPLAALVRTGSLFPAAPFLLLAWIGHRAAPTDRMDDARPHPIGAIVLVYAAAYALIAPELASVGAHWGNRFLLPAYPLLAILATVNLTAWTRLPSRRRRASVAIGAVIAVSLAAQLTSIGTLDKKKTFSHRLIRAVDARPEPAIVTDAWWAGHELFPEYRRRPTFFVSTPAQLEVLKRRLRGRGVDELLFVTPAVDATREQADTVVDDRGLGNLSLALIPISTRRDGTTGPR